MSAPLVIPFNFQPVQTVVTNASYTVPSGKYAKIVAFFTAGRSVSVNATNLVPATTNDSIKYITLNGSNILMEKVINVTLTAARTTLNGSTTATYNLTGFYGANSTYSITTYVSSTVTTSPFPSNPTSGVTSGTFSFSGTAFATCAVGGSAANPSITAILGLSNSTLSDKIEFWAKAGDVITATASSAPFSIIYTEYNNIS
jgi:hypothetical protein